MTFEPSLTRKGLDWLLSVNPHLELISAEWQIGGAWLLVTLGQLSPTSIQSRPIGGGAIFARHPYAIWQATGAVFGVFDGAVGDDPLFTP